MQCGATRGAVPALLLLLLCAPSLLARQNGTDELEQQGDTVVAWLVLGSTEGHGPVRWGPQAFCSPGSYAVAFRLKLEPIMFHGGFTALNGVKLYCIEREKGRRDHNITSTLGYWGLWGDVFTCASGLLAGVRMRVEQPWVDERDKFAANNLAMECENGERMTGDGTDRGRWGEWQRCPQGSAICGLATQVKQPQHIFDDDASLVSAAFYCCSV
ncbi:vitelline membrane outer layer protein 1-like [Eriocheir sinensis]|uniref:vitelline membrane outer layer protein 1-like n=1 Tax=Eriocheir sinensis TaxID=95602 RepID=UPI0021C92932|nr:vitelline membrane outer layer protein 1-like [Eriocheir sinensis]